MDEPSQPTAAELGISEEEYGRILRDLHNRRGIAAPAPDGGGHDQGRARRWRRADTVRLAVSGVLLLVYVVGRLADAGPNEPTYEFMQVSGGQPATYTSCRQIQVAIFPEGGPPDAEELVRDAVTEVRSATGLDIVVSGVFGGHAPNWNFAAVPVHPDDPISVSWQDGDALAEMTDHVAGLGGSRTTTFRDGSPRLIAGTIAVSRDYYAYLEQTGRQEEELAILLHEFGHVFGLSHVDSPDELMAATGQNRYTYGKGDLEGLRRLGQGPCA